MTDIIEHLRRQASRQDMLTCEDMLQAADEIEAQRERVRQLTDEIERLRAALYRARWEGEP